MNYRLSFLAVLLREAGSQLSMSTERDSSYIESRLEHEGISFLTITLPSFCDAVEHGIEEGVVTPGDFSAFAKKRSGCLPKFLSGFTNRVFHEDGTLRADVCKDTVYLLRQITRFYKKAEIPCSPARIEAAQQKYVSTDLELENYEAFISRDHVILDKITSIVMADLFDRLDYSDIRCSHGPGATAERLSRNGRRQIRQWPIRAEPFYPSSWHAIPNMGYISELSKIELLSPDQEPPVRVVFVPKTLKSPRVIAIEPSHMQFMQQGLMKWMVDRIEKSPLTRNSVHFSDQSINNESARRASIDKRNATIDLSEASDRVSLSLVKRIFSGNRKLLNLALASRSDRALLPSGLVIKLNKFASMGSATCFPTEALVFYCLILTAVHKSVGIHPSTKSIKNISHFVHVYGDDLIVPVGWLAYVVKELEDFGLQVNQHKTFSKSNFRESCGGDYFDGYSVKPVYHRVDPRSLNGRLSPNDLVSLCSMSNQLYANGLWTTCQAVRDYIEAKLRRDIPVRSYECSGLYFSSGRRSTYNRWHRRYQRLYSRGLVTSTVTSPDNITANIVAAVTMGLENIGNECSLDLTTSVRRQCLRLKTGGVA